MSSSNCSQRNASPCKRSFKLSSWACGAFANSGYFVAGKLTMPVLDLLGVRPLDAGEGHVSFSLPTSDWLCLERGQVASAEIAHGPANEMECTRLRLAPEDRVYRVHRVRRHALT